MSGINEMTARINEVSTGYTRSAVLFAGVEAGVFPLLETPRTADETAECCGWNPRGVRMLLDGLVALELLERRGGRYVNTPIASACLVPEGEAYQGNIIRHNRNGWDAWGRLAEAVKTGEPLRDRSEQERGPEELCDFILGMKDGGSISARAMLDVLDLGRYRHMLDAGGGPATYSITFLNAWPQLKATLFDRPAVVEIARREVEEAGMTGRFDFRAGDLTRDELGEGYDLVLVSNIIHSLSPETNLELMCKVFRALVPGGTVIVKDFLVDNDRGGPAFSLIFALRMLLHTDGGDTYTCEQVAAWTRAAGFDEGRLLELTPRTRMWLADKPR